MPDVTTTTPATPPASPRLFLIDGYALIYRAFFALLQRPLATSRGENTSIAWGIASFLKRLLATHKPELLGWVHDSGKTFRDDLYPDYKATREKLADDLQADFDRGRERVLQLLAAYGIPVLTAEGFEADDVIGTLASKGVAAGYNVVIVSGDKDFQQLVEPGVWLLNPGRGGPASVEEQWVGMHNANDRLGVPPERVIDYLAIVGDSSDNVPGVKGIGEKGAIELINQYGPLEEILAHVHEITKKRPREALLEYEANARLSKVLVTIRRDVPVPFDPSTLTMSAPDTNALRTLYTELEFTSLLKDVTDASTATAAAADAGDMGPRRTSAVPTAPGAVAIGVDRVVGESGVAVLEDARYATVDTIEAMTALLARAREVSCIAFDTETVIEPGSPYDVDAMRSRLVGLSIAVAPGEAYYLPFAHRHDDGSGNLALLAGDAGIAGKRIHAGTPAAVNLPAFDSDACAPLRALLEDASVKKMAQNAKYDMLVLRGAGVRIAGLEFDTMLASYVLDPGRRAHGLDLLAFEFLGHTMTSYDQLVGKGKQQLPFDVVPVDAARDYSCEDVDITLRLRAVLEADARSAWGAVAVRHDRDSARERARRYGVRWRRDQPRMVRVTQDALRNGARQGGAGDLWRCGARVQHQFESAAPRDSLRGTRLAREEEDGDGAEYRCERCCRSWRKKAICCRPCSWSTASCSSSRAPTSTRCRSSCTRATIVCTRRTTQTISATGRLSSSDPNLQNIPIRRELGRDIRRGFVPRDGWQMLSADYSQIELRLLAHLSHDDAFVQAFRAGGDIHKQTAAVIFGVDLADVTSEMRARAKTINFATIYGQGAFALSRQLKITNAEAKAFIDTYFERFRRREGVSRAVCGGCA